MKKIRFCIENIHSNCIVDENGDGYGFKNFHRFSILKISSFLKIMRFFFKFSAHLKKTFFVVF